MEKSESLVYLLELKQLESLDLSLNNFSYSSIPKFMGSMKQLRYLNLSSASFGGLVPYELGNLTNLRVLDVGSVKQVAVDSLSWVSRLRELQYLSMSGVQMRYAHDWMESVIGPLPYIRELHLPSCGLTLYNVVHKNSSFAAHLPIRYLDLSMNNFLSINLSNNSLSGIFFTNDSKTSVYRQATVTVLSNNFISGPLPESLCHIMPNLEDLALDNNQISGSIPDPFCQFKSLTVLKIQNNSLSGVIPNCWGLGKRMPILEYLDLSDNQFEGPIPDSLCRVLSLELLNIGKNRLSGLIPNCWSNVSSLSIVNLSYLHLNDNMLSGEIPSSLCDLTNLRVLDIGGNQLSGKMHKWFKAEKFGKLKILRLRGNKFSGTIPTQICFLPYLQLIDLGHNHFTGSIPRCLSNLTSMTSPNASYDFYLSDVSEVILGIEHAYTSTLPYLVAIDFSFNNLVGRIPDDITRIYGLLSLNLSFNQLSGTIPENIGGLKSLVSLDLSENKLTGNIPTSISELYSLSHLNLSYNNLSGQIPTGNQLQTLSDQASIYAGNPYLCGDSLPKKCKSKVDNQVKGRSDKLNGHNAKKFEKMGFSLVVMSGFATGFWGVVGCLVLNMRWRHAVFQRLEDGYNWLYVIVALRVAKAKINWR